MKFNFEGSIIYKVFNKIEILCNIIQFQDSRDRVLYHEKRNASRQYEISDHGWILFRSACCIDEIETNHVRNIVDPSRFPPLFKHVT